MMLAATVEAPAGRAPAERVEREAAQYTRPGLQSAVVALQEAARFVAVARPGLLAVARNSGIHCKPAEPLGHTAGKSR